MPALPNTIAAPSTTPGGSRFPNNDILINKLTSFLKFSTIVTPNAEVCAASELTPRMQTYCVKALRARVAICVGIVIVLILEVWEVRNEGRGMFVGGWS